MIKLLKSTVANIFGAILNMLYIALAMAFFCLLIYTLVITLEYIYS